MTISVKDRSDVFPGQIVRHGCDHLRTSDEPVATDFGHATGEGPMQDHGTVPTFHDSTEVAQIVTAGEPCTGEEAMRGGPEGPGSVHQGPTDGNDGFSKADGKSHGVSTHPQLQRAHQLSSITHEDHKALHNCEKDGARDILGEAKPELAKPVVQKVEAPQEPATWHGDDHFNQLPTSSGGAVARLERQGPIRSR